MKRLVYFSPVPWADFAQRPHKFAEWHHARYGSKVLWVEPYPTRLPQLNDLRRLHKSLGPPGQEVPSWLECLSVPALPVEPLPGGTLLNSRLWKTALARIAAFAAEGDCELVLGKPSRLALLVLKEVRFSRTVYDAMDDIPAFHSGLSSHSIAATEVEIASRVDLVQASASKLVAKFAGLGANTSLVRNACDPARFPGLAQIDSQREPDLIGYVGTLASWFDWELVISLARARERLRFRLIGPLHQRPPAALPPNIELRPPCPHPIAMQEMARFAVGLIPFHNNQLTSAVDPVKYYEYRGLGVPVLTTAFGEMPEHAREDQGVLMVRSPETAVQCLDAAVESRTDRGWVERFRSANSWHTRFASCPTANHSQNADQPIKAESKPSGKIL